MLGRGAWRGLLVVVLVLAGAWVATGQLPHEGGGDVGPHRVLVGDLKLADDDEGPSDGVEATFVGHDLAPGDQVTGRLDLFRENPKDLPPPSRPQVELRFDHESRPAAFADQFGVEKLSYGERDLTQDVRQQCEEPVTLAELSRCTQEGDNPLSGLADPTPDGRSLDAVFRFEPAAGSQFAGAELDFRLAAELSGRAPIDTGTRTTELGPTPDEPDCEVLTPRLELGVRGLDPDGSGLGEGLPVEAEAWLRADLAQVC